MAACAISLGWRGAVTASAANSLDGGGKAADNGRAASLEVVEIGLSNHKADKPLYAVFLRPFALLLRLQWWESSGGAFERVGFFVADRPTSLFFRPLRLVSMGGNSIPHKGAYPMPKSARTFLTYSLVAITTLAIERNTPITVIALSLAALVLVHVIGGRNHAE